MFKQNRGLSLPSNSVGFFKGSSDTPLYSSDVNYPEYQEAFFYYLFGVTEMDCYGIIDFETETATLFVPKMDHSYKIWMTVLSTEDYKHKYSLVEEVMFTQEI